MITGAGHRPWRAQEAEASRLIQFSSILGDVRFGSLKRDISHCKNPEGLSPATLQNWIRRLASASCARQGRWPAPMITSHICRTGVIKGRSLDLVLGGCQRVCATGRSAAGRPRPCGACGACGAGGAGGVIRLSFDHFVGADEQRRRHGKAERLGGLEVNHQFEFSWNLNGQVGWLRSAQNTFNIGARAAKYI